MRKILSLLFCLGGFMAAGAQTLPLDSCIRKGTLSNGLTYYIRHNAQTPGQADFYIAQRVGSILEEPQQRGLAHFLEHMAFNGTRHFPDGNGGERSVRSWCERNGIKFGADLNAYTSIDQTVYNISNAPITKAGVADTCLIILHDWAGSLLLKDNEIDQERGVIREEWRTRRSRMASMRMMEDAMPVIYAGSKYADCLPIGHIEVVDTFRYDVLRDYYRRWYRPDLQGIIVVGDINVDEMEAKIKNLFKDDTVPAGAPERTYYGVPDNKEKTRNAEYAKSIVANFCNAEPCMNIEYEAALEAEFSATVTIDDINKTLKDIITDENQVCMVFGPTQYDGKAYTMPTNDQFKTWIEAAQKKEYADDDKAGAVDPTFMKKLPKKGKIVSKREVANGYTEYVLSNGIKVSARPSDIEPNRLTINMFRLGGRSLYPDSDAATLQFLGSVVRESGAADFDYLTLEKKRRGKALRVVPYIDSEEEGVKGVCVASDFETWLQVMYLYLTQPRKDKAIFQNLIAKQRSMLKNRNASPNVTYNDSLRVAVYGHRKRTEPITAERLDEVNFDRMYEIYHERFANLEGMNLIVTGDIREDLFEDLLCQYVASLPGKKAKKGHEADHRPGQYALDIERGKTTTVFHQTLKTPSALTNVLYTADVPYTADNDLKLDVLSQIMRAVYTETVREEKGGTYGVSVDGQFWKYPTEGCSMTVNFRCDPKKYDDLLPVIDEQLQRMAKEGPTEEQLKNVKEYERKNYDRAVLTNGWWEYVRYHELRDGIDFNDQYLQKVDRLTPADIRDFCRLLTTSGNRIQVTMK